MIWVDMAYIALIVINAVAGLARGYRSAKFSLLVWLLGIGVAWFFTQDFAVLLAKLIVSPSTRLVAAFACLVAITLVIGWVIRLLLNGLKQAYSITLLERFGGLVLGVFQGFAVAFMFVSMAGLTALPKEGWWSESRYIPPYETAAKLAKNYLPSKLSIYMEYPKSVTDKVK